MGATFAHTRPKTTTHRGFRALFGAVQARWKGFSASVCDNSWNMDPPLHTWNKKIVSWVDSNWWNPSKATKNSTVGSQGHQEKTASHAKEKSAVPPRQCTVPQVHENDGQIEWIKLRNASSPTIFSRSGPWWLVAHCWPEKNAPRKEIWLQCRSDCRNWGLFWEQRRIILQKRHRKVREAMEWMYYAWRKLCWWILLRPKTYWVMCYIIQKTNSCIDSFTIYSYRYHLFLVLMCHQRY